MKTTLFTVTGIFILFLLSACEKGMEDMPEPQSSTGSQASAEETPGNIPEGYFEVSFSPGQGDHTRAAITGVSGRVRHLRYIIYKSTGEYVKEKVVLTPNDPAPSWPFAAVKDTLPKGKYIAVFLANVEKTLFPIPAAGGGTNYTEVLANYKTMLADARIVLPNVEFTDTSEYYWANINFSDDTPQPYIILQRIISVLKLHRNFVDTQQALNQLINNIDKEINYKNILTTTVRGLLLKPITDAMNLGALGNLIYNVVGGLDKAVNLVLDGLVGDVVDAVYHILLQELVNQVGLALTGNANQSGALAGLGVLLNPWAQNEVHTAIVTIHNFPKTMDFSLNVKDYYTGDQRFKYAFTGASVYDEKDILIKGFNGTFDIRKINVIKKGLVSGLLVDQIIDSSLLLNGAFIDITDPLQTNISTNFRYKADYSFLDLGLKSYAQQTDGNKALKIKIKLGNIANIDNILAGIPVVGDLIDLVVLGLIKNIEITVPVNLPLLGVENLELSGSWSPVSTY